MVEEQKRLKSLFDAEVENLCDLIGLEARPQYSFRVTNKNSRVVPRLARAPLVEIGTDYHENPYALAGEAGHIVFDFARKQLGLRDLPIYGEVFDFFNQIRRMHETGNADEAEKWLKKAYHTRDPFIEKIEQIALRSVHSGAKNAVAEMSREFVQQCREYGETLPHMAAIVFIRLACKNMHGTKPIGHLMRLICRRETDFGVKMGAGDYSGFLEELNFFTSRPREISEALTAGKVSPRETIPRRPKRGWKSIFSRRRVK